MKVDLLLFAGLREALGSSRMELELPDGATGADLKTALSEHHPRWGGLIASCRFAQGVDFLDESLPLRDSEPVAVIPPVSGGSGPPRVRLTSEPLESAPLEEAVTRPEAGAVCVFVGTTRSPNGGRVVVHLDYEAHEPMALAQMERIVDAAEGRWEGCRALLHHRLGRVRPAEPSVIIAVSAPHRGDAFEACRFVLERLKQDVPIWKKEVFADGSQWVGPATHSTPPSPLPD